MRELMVSYPGIRGKVSASLLHAMMDPTLELLTLHPSCSLFSVSCNLLVLRGPFII